RGSARNSRLRRSASRSTTSNRRGAGFAPLPKPGWPDMGYTLNFAAVWRNFDFLLSGLALSLGLAVISIFIGAAIGLAVAFALTSKSRLIGVPARLYVTVIRNLPILVLVLFAYFALPQMGFRLGKIESFMMVLSLYSGAYLAEVFRAGLLSIPRGLTEAGLAIGLTPMQIRVSIIVPLMLRN